MLHQTGTPAGRPVHCRRLTAIRRSFLIAGFTTLSLAAASGQFVDPFDDPYIHPWTGDTTAFRIASGQLQLVAPSGTSTARLHVGIPFADSMEWSLQARLDFAPSASNQLRFWLGMTDPDPLAARGYLLEAGATGDQDALRLLYAAEGEYTLIAESPPGVVARDPVVLDLLIRAGADGTWRIDNLAGDSTAHWIEAQHTGPPLSSLQFLSIECRFTETRRDKFSFDEVHAGPTVPDTLPPLWTETIVLDEHTVRLHFDENLDSITVHQADHYKLLPDGAEVSVVTGVNNRIDLAWTNAFQSDSSYALQVSGLSDLAGNWMAPAIQYFRYIRVDTADPGDLQVTEIMADPTPSVGLPESEYVELYNGSGRTFRLSDYQLRVGNNVRPLADSLMRPGDYILVCPVAQQAGLKTYGRVMPLHSFPVLPNDGETISLVGPDEVTVHSVDYDRSTYRDPDKDDGGWSLEMRNPMARCTDAGNWQASLDLEGGTPGRVNSAWMPVPDVTGPVLREWVVLPPDTLRLSFDENIDTDLMLDPLRYATAPPLGIQGIQASTGVNVSIHFQDTLTEGIEYRLVKFPSFDCLGNPGIMPDPVPVFGRPVKPWPGSLVINELLFDPAPGGARFIEVLNTSNVFLDIGKLAFGRITPSETELFALNSPRALGPGAIAAFSPDTGDIIRRYRVPYPARLYPATLPAWEASADQVSLLSRGEVLDSLTYSASWHHPLIRDPEGVSLERIAPGSPAGDPASWHSAAGTSGWATPTAVNSHILLPGSDTARPYTVTDPVFSPNNDGYRDFLAITLQPDGPDQVASVLVHDLEGRLVRTLANNTLIGNTRPLHWDGRKSNGEPVPRGMYVLFIRLWRPDGSVRVYRETCAVVYP